MSLWRRVLIAIIGLAFLGAGAFNLPDSSPIGVALVVGAFGCLVLAIVPLEGLFRVPGLFEGRIREAVREEVEPIREEVRQVHQSVDALIVKVPTIEATGEALPPTIVTENDIGEES